VAAYVTAVAAYVAGHVLLLMWLSMWLLKSALPELLSGTRLFASLRLEHLMELAHFRFAES
jgi:hypothetical protein